MRTMTTAVLCAMLLVPCSAAMGAEATSHEANSARTSRTFVVNNRAANASDDNPGTVARPLKTIQAGASLARAGDTVLVKEGIYREEVVPPRGGTSPQKPIIYRAAPAEEVSIRGSERITTWVDQGDGVWMVELDTSFFKGYNPFAIPVWGAWLHRGRDRRLGDVYSDGEASLQKMKIEDMRATPNTWYTDLSHGYVNAKDFPEARKYPGGKIKIWANFGNVDPNRTMTEINARETAIFPEKSGLKYIVIDGFDIRHTAPQWGDIYWTEKGAVGPKYGYGWTIQNCTITNSRNIGISLGVTDAVHFPRRDEGGLLEGGSNIPPLDKIGHHVIRNNVIRRCGQTGIYGCYGAVGCLIEGNVISESNYRKEWFGTNQAAIKILFPIDVVIRNNLINGMPGESNNAKGIWLDWGSQNTRVTGNIIRDFGNNRGLFLEVNFGPIIVDNNVIVRSSVLVESNGVVLAHNLFDECHFHFMASPKRTVPYYKPHSTVRAGKTAVSLLHNRIYNNLIIGGDGFNYDGLLREGSSASGVDANHNVFLDGAGPFPGKDDKSVVDSAETGLVLEGVGGIRTLKMKLPDAVFQGKHPLITSKLIGRIPLADMCMENPDGTPLDITFDFNGRPIDPARVMPGPFQNIRKGKNSFVLRPRTPTN
ncbi:MAG: right-handed parallel beta-helix repeat-containing protein [Candidatus Nealsonbacteria bacterium]|nr:right-handed parallel beta-helix repeat-containing protein [Candidatus Nealsonbacteria bacterium]